MHVVWGSTNRARYAWSAPGIFGPGDIDAVYWKQQLRFSSTAIGLATLYIISPINRIYSLVPGPLIAGQKQSGVWE